MAPLSKTLLMACMISLAACMDMGMGGHMPSSGGASTFPPGSPCELTELVLTHNYTVDVCYVTEPFELHGHYPLYITEAGAVAASTNPMPMAMPRGGHGFKFYSPLSSWGYKSGTYNATTDGMYTMDTNRTVVSCSCSLCLAPPSLHFSTHATDTGSVCEEAHVDFHSDNMGMHDSDMCFVAQPFSVGGAYPLYFTRPEAMAASPTNMAHSIVVGPKTFYMPMGVPMWHSGYTGGGSSAPASGGGHHGGGHHMKSMGCDSCMPMNSTSAGEYCNHDGSAMMAMCASCDTVSRGCHNQGFTQDASLQSCLQRCPGRGLKHVSCTSSMCGRTSSFSTMDADTDTDTDAVPAPAPSPMPAVGSICVPSGQRAVMTTGGATLTVGMCALPQPFALNGDYPLYLTRAMAEAASPTNMSHTHGGYHMPMGVTMYHGDYTGTVMAMDLALLSCDDALCTNANAASVTVPAVPPDETLNPTSSASVRPGYLPAVAVVALTMLALC